MEFLKEILGDMYDSFAERISSYNTANPDKAVKLANLSAGEYVSKEKHTALEGTVAEYKKQIADRDKQLATLAKSAGDNEDLKNQIQKLQNDNKTALEDAEKKVAKAQYDSALEIALAKSGAKSTKALRGLLDMDSIKFENGTLTGFDEQLTAIKAENDYLFEDGTPSTGMEHGGTGSKLDGVEQRFYERNPDLKTD